MSDTGETCPLCGRTPAPVCATAVTLACPNWEDTRDLDCPQCGAGVPALRWHEPDEEWPEGEYLAWDGDEHICPECGWLLQVHTDDEQAWLFAVHCRHGRAEDQPCWVCDLKAKISGWRCLLLRSLRQIWCASGGHQWTQYRWVPGKVHELCRCGVSREAPNA